MDHTPAYGKLGLMEKDKSQGSTWAGIALLIIAGIHTAFGLLIGLRLLPDPEMQRLMGERVPLHELKPVFLQQAPLELAPLTMFWFLFFGLAVVPLGALVRHLEKQGQPVPHFVGYHLLALVLGRRALHAGLRVLVRALTGMEHFEATCGKIGASCGGVEGSAPQTRTARLLQLR